MDKYIHLLSTLTTIAFVLLLLILVAVFIHYCRTKSMEKKLLGTSGGSSNIIKSLLSTAFPDGHSFHSVTLPYQTKTGVIRRAPIDHLLIDRAGVFIIRERTEPGLVHNRRDGSNWSINYRRNSFEFPDPFRQNVPGAKAVQLLLEHEGIHHVPIYHIVCFSNPQVRLASKCKNLVTSDQLIPVLKQYNRNEYLSQIDINYSLRCVEKYAKPIKPAGK